MTPSESLSTQCPDNPCHTLQHYVEHGNYYFQLASDCTFQFLPGNHILSADEIVFIRYVTNFALSGSGNTSVIECLGATGFCFLNTINVTVANLTFMFCGGMSPYLSPATLTFGGWAFDVKILEITVINGTGYGLLGIDIVGNSSIAGSLFISNGIDRNLTDITGKGGGNVRLVFLQNCHNPESSYTIDIQSSVFINGYGGIYGAGLEILPQQSCYHLRINIRRIKCFYNTGKLGGNIGILVKNGTVYNNVTIEESIIAYGASQFYGGGISFVTNSDFFGYPFSCSDVNQAEVRTTLYLRNTRILSNVAIRSGGGVAIAMAHSCYNTHVHISNVTLSKNVALYGSNV